MNGNVKRFDFSEEAKMIPRWAIALGVILFIGMQLVWHVLIPHQHPPQDVPPLGLRLFLGLFLGALLIVWSLLIGYVNRDSKRRGMNRALWTVIAIFVPNGVGFILYFLLRDPLRDLCPKCGAGVDTGYTFCPKCRFELRPTCPKCGQTVHVGDVYCAHCGNDLSTATK